MTTHPGSNSSYQSGCRCVLCRGAHTAYERDRRRRKIEGEPSRLLYPAAQWAQFLREATLPTTTLRAISDASGVPIATLDDIRAGRVASISVLTYARLAQMLETLPERTA